MFTPAARDQLLAELLSRARADPSVSKAALVGSAARGATDRWSDIDLALGLAPGTDPTAAAAGWTARLGELVRIADHLDLWSGPALYRVFLTDDSLQVDLSFWPADDLSSTGEPFALIFGSAPPVRVPAEPELEPIIGWAWLYALHTRSALARRRHWQALQMLDGLRGQLVALTCLRHNLPGHQGRGVDRLPAAVLADLRSTLPARPDPAPLTDAFAAAVGLLLAEAAHVDPELAARLHAPLSTLLQTAGGHLQSLRPETIG